MQHWLTRSYWQKSRVFWLAYWVAIGALTITIVSGLVAGPAPPEGSGATIAFDNTPSPTGGVEAGAGATPTADETDHSDEPGPMSTATASEDPADGHDGMRGMDGTGGTDQTPPASADTESACRDVYAAQQPALQDAATAMVQWQVHIGAMNKLVGGAITLAQASQFWGQTRVGAKAHVAAFASSYGEYQQRTTRCPPPVGRAGSGDDSTCRRSVATRSRVLHLSRGALATWSRHVMHMEMLRDGRMSAARATQLWLQNWKAGQLQVEQYAAALRSVPSAGC